MLKATHKIWADLVFEKYIFRLLKKHFYSVHFLNFPEETDKNKPLILTPIHSTWWDGFFVYLINKKLFNRKFYIMILEEQLKKYKFFMKLGGYSIDRNNPKKIIESLKYSADIMLGNKNSVLNIFPQGELLPITITDIKFNNGVKKIIDIYGDDVQVMNLAIKPIFLNEQTPQLFFKFGKLHYFSKNNNIDMHEHQSEMQKLLCEINQSVNCRDFGKIILKGKKSLSE